MIKKLFKKLFSNTGVYDFFSWQRSEYLAMKSSAISHRDIRYMGVGAHISDSVKINKPDRVVLKKYAYIARGTVINSMGGLYVGCYSGIGYNCVIWTAEHNYRKSRTIPFDDRVDLKPVVIRDFVWIGSNVKILPGKEIGEGAIVGLGSVITKDVPAFAIVLGNPAEIVGYRDEDHFNKCKNDGLFQSSRVNLYTERIYPYHRRKFKKELEELGL